MKYSIHSQNPRYPLAKLVNPVVSGFLVISQEDVVDLLNTKDKCIVELERTIKNLTDGVAHFNKSHGDMTPLLGVYIEALKEQGE